MPASSLRRALLCGVLNVCVRKGAMVRVAFLLEVLGLVVPDTEGDDGPLVRCLACCVAVTRGFILFAHLGELDGAAELSLGAIVGHPVVQGEDDDSGSGKEVVSIEASLFTPRAATATHSWRGGRPSPPTRRSPLATTALLLQLPEPYRKLSPGLMLIGVLFDGLCNTVL